MYRKKKPYGKSVYRSLALVMQFGLNMLVPICMTTAAGIFLDKKLGTSYWVIILFFVGAIAGGQNIYRMAKRIYDTPEKKEQQEHKKRKERDDRDAGGRNTEKDK